MKIVNMHEAKTTRSQLGEQVENGEEVILARSGKPVARVVAIRNTGRRTLIEIRSTACSSQALSDGVPLVSSDPQIARYPVQVIW